MTNILCFRVCLNCRYNITNPDDPYFVIEPLEALMHYNNLYDDFGDNNAFKAVIYAINQKGRSQGVIVKDFFFESTTTENRASKWDDVFGGSFREHFPNNESFSFMKCDTAPIFFLEYLLFPSANIFNDKSMLCFFRLRGIYPTSPISVLTSNSLESLSPILFGILFTLLVLCFVIFVRFYYIKATTTSTTITNVSSDLVSNTKQHGSKQDSAGKVSLVRLP